MKKLWKDWHYMLGAALIGLAFMIAAIEAKGQTPVDPPATLRGYVFIRVQGETLLMYGLAGEGGVTCQVRP